MKEGSKIDCSDGYLTENILKSTKLYALNRWIVSYKAVSERKKNTMIQYE